MKGLEDKPQNGPKSQNCSNFAKWAICVQFMAFLVKQF
jgi:hypothetical protein